MIVTIVTLSAETRRAVRIGAAIGGTEPAAWIEWVLLEMARMTTEDESQKLDADLRGSA
jgi:hypothetical protein